MEARGYISTASSPSPGFAAAADAPARLAARSVPSAGAERRAGDVGAGAQRARDLARPSAASTSATPNSASEAGSGTWPGGSSPGFGKPGSLSDVPYWNQSWETLPLADGSKPAGSPDRVKTTSLRISACAPVTAAFPVAGLSLADARLYCMPSTPTGPCRLPPGKLAAPKRPKPELLMPEFAEYGAAMP